MNIELILTSMDAYALVFNYLLLHVPMTSLKPSFALTFYIYVQVWWSKTSIVSWYMT